MIYAGFGKRFGAQLVDLLVLTPLILFSLWVYSRSRQTYQVYCFVFWFVATAYQVVCISCWGQTLGKRVAGIRVVRHSGQRTAWREGLLRDSVGALLGLGGNVATVIALGLMSDAAWSSDNKERWRQLEVVRPVWGRWLGDAWIVWTVGELITLLFNKKKRSLHDFIAGTVVVDTTYEAASPPESLTP